MLSERSIFSFYFELTLDLWEIVKKVQEHPMHPSHQPDEKSILTIFAMKGGNKLKGLAKKRAVSGLA